MAHIDANESELTNIPDQNRDAFIGGYVPRAIKQALRDEARINHRTLSQQLNLILSKHYATTKER